jgi:hypothetical protein
MDDWPAPPAHIVALLYTVLAATVLSVVFSAHPFQCV